MTIAFATNDGVHITGHIGRCRQFKIVELNGGTIVRSELRDNTFTHHRTQEHASGDREHTHGGGGHSHAQLVEGLSDCSVVIARSAGWRVIDDLKAVNIQPLLTEVESIDEAVNQFAAGMLKENPALVCRHEH